MILGDWRLEIGDFPLIPVEKLAQFVIAPRRGLQSFIRVSVQSFMRVSLLYIICFCNC